MKTDTAEDKFLQSYDCWKSIYRHYNKYIEQNYIEKDEFSLFSLILFINLMTAVEDFFDLPESIRIIHGEKITEIQKCGSVLKECILNHTLDKPYE